MLGQNIYLRKQLSQFENTMTESLPKTALITGASSGIGYELAKQLASDGYNVVLVARESEKLANVKAELAAIYPTQRVQALAVDLSLPGASDKIFASLKRDNIVIDVLVNCAGFGDYGFFVSREWPKQESMISVNITALTHLTHLFLPLMLKRKRGGILNIASTAAFQPGPLMAVYYATKAYVLSFSEALANEVAGSGVTITCVCPGATSSGFQKAAALEESKLFKGRRLPSSKAVAEFAYRAFARQQVVAIHGWRNFLMAQAVRFLPRGWVVRLVRAIQER